MLTIIHFFANIVYCGEQPERKVELKMGYFKQLEIELQDIHDPYMRQVVLWKRAHEHLMTAEELWAVMTDEVKMQRALVLWENELFTPEPVKAADHVALQTRRRDVRPRKNGMCVAGWTLIAVSLVTGVTVLVVNL
jgi:hypothetical protein